MDKEQRKALKMLIGIAIFLWAVVIFLLWLGFHLNENKHTSPYNIQKGNREVRIFNNERMG